MKANSEKNIIMEDNIKDMETIRSYKFRIYPDIKKQSEINNMLVLAQRLYNKLLEKSIQSYKNGKGKTSISQFNESRKEVIAENKDFLKLYSQTGYKIEYMMKRGEFL